MNRPRKGFVTVLMLLSLLMFSSVTLFASFHLTNRLFSQRRQERIAFLAEESSEEIFSLTRLRSLAALSAQPWGRDRLSKDVIGEVVRRLPSAELISSAEEIFYVAFLRNGLAASRPFSEQRLAEQFKDSIGAVMERISPSPWRTWKSSGNVALVLIERFDNTGRWLMVPSLLGLERSAGGSLSSWMEMMFRMILYANPYAGVGDDSARKTWEHLRRLEISNTGRDSLGMYPGNSIF